MVGIVYKFTIIAKYKMDGHHPFYIGQHWCKSKEDFLNRDYPYYGSGSIWNDFLSKIKKEYPTKWRYFIRREILCCVNNDENQRMLDKLEEYWIKREKAHKSKHLGGCNILWGTANNFASGSPSKQDFVKMKIKSSVDDWYRSEAGLKFKKRLSEQKKGKKLSDEVRDKIKTLSPNGDKSYWYGKKLSEETKRKISEKAKQRNKDLGYRKMVRDKTNYRYGECHPNFGKHLFVGKDNPFYGKRHTDESKKKMSDSHKKNKIQD